MLSVVHLQANPVNHPALMKAQCVPPVLRTLNTMTKRPAQDWKDKKFVLGEDTRLVKPQNIIDKLPAPDRSTDLGEAVPDKETRFNGVYAISRLAANKENHAIIGTKGGIKLLVDLVSSEDVRVRCLAVNALRHLALLPVNRVQMVRLNRYL